MTAPFKKKRTASGPGRKSGLPPGSLIYVGKKKPREVRITRIRYNPEGLEEKAIEAIEDCFPLNAQDSVLWINIDGLYDVEIIAKVGDYLGIHPLVLEDILNTEQRPKIEDFSDYLFIVLKTLYHDEKESEIIAEQISLIVGSDYVISFREKESDIFNGVKERLKKSRGRLRQGGPDYLAYTLLDAIVDNYFVTFEKVGEEIEYLEEKLISNPTPPILQVIHKLKRTLISLRRSVWPLREVVGRLERGDSSLIKESTDAYFRDVYDHTVRVLETIESYHDMIAGMLDIYLSGVSNRLNEVMKVLTIIATIFIPLTFLTGVFGMNFTYMPILKVHFGFYGLLILMLLIVVFMAACFRKKGWL